MIYQEKDWKWYLAVPVLLAAFWLLYSPLQTDDKELYWSEGSFAAMSQEINYMAPVNMAHGEIVPSAFPLYPLLTAVFTREFSMPMEFSLRIISVGALVLMTLLMWETVRLSIGIHAAPIAVAMLISSNIIIEKSLDGYPNMLGLLFLVAGWMFWFWLGAVRGSWNLSWIVSMLLCGLGFYTIGWAGIVYFFVPLVFMRRPLTLWPKLRRPGFYLGLIVLLAFILIWWIPRIISNGSEVRNLSDNLMNLNEYGYHLLVFPFDVLGRFFPWTLIAWAPFCVALQPLEVNPIFNRFLRIITISLFFLLWLSPFTEPRDITLLAPTLSALCGSYYWIVIRRYGCLFQKILRLLPIFAITCGAIIIIFFLTPAGWWRGFGFFERGISFHDVPIYWITAVVYGSVAVATGFYFMFMPKRFTPIWVTLLATICVIMIFFWSIVHPYNAQENSKRTLGKELRQAIEKFDTTPQYVYKGENIAGLYSECFYMGLKVKKLNSLAELPKHEKIVFLLSTNVPLHQSRAWGDPLVKKQYRRGELYLYRGVLKEVPAIEIKEDTSHDTIF
jgi:4-amino-4-deoxy-L-arabinose transferase-like glycosyltransferase